MEGKFSRILAADCGTVTTRVALIEQTDLRYQLVAQADVASTHFGPLADITHGLINALRIIESKTGYRLIAQDNTPLIPRMADSSGADALTAVVSAAEPLRIGLAGLMHDVSLQVARQAASTTYTTIANQFSIDDYSAPSGNSIEERLKAIRQTDVDVIVLVGGTDGGAEAPIIEMAQIITLALKTMPSHRRPHVLYAGNTRLRVKMAELFGNLTDFMSVDNVLPALGVKNPGPLQVQLDVLFRQHKLTALPGFNKLAQWSSSRIVATSRSFAQTIHYLGQSYRLNVLGVDIGGSATTVAAANTGAFYTFTRSDLGVGRTAPGLLTPTSATDDPPAEFTRRLPFALSAADAANFLRNKGLYPQTVPQTYREIFLELALAHQVISRTHNRFIETTVGNQQPWDLVVGSGQALTNLPSPELAVYTLLNSLQPAGIFTLALDRHGLLAMLGGLALLEPQAAVQIAAQDTLANLATVIAPAGIGVPGKTALKLKITWADERREDLKIPFGVIRIIPLPSAEQAKIEVRPTGDLTMNPGGEIPGRGAAAVVEGGQLGLIIDARGRPLRVPATEQLRIEQHKTWLQQLEIDLEAMNLTPLPDLL